jgi:hypothetical protein
MRLTTGYGRLKIRGQLNNATRWMIYATDGFDFDRWKLACHKCDNPPCIKREHLFVGDPYINNRDAQLKGRNDPRKINPPKLGPEDVESVVRVLRQTRSIRQTAKRFNVDRYAIESLFRREGVVYEGRVGATETRVFLPGEFRGNEAPTRARDYTRVRSHVRRFAPKDVKCWA